MQDARSSEETCLDVCLSARPPASSSGFLQCNAMQCGAFFCLLFFLAAQQLSACMCPDTRYGYQTRLAVVTYAGRKDLYLGQLAPPTSSLAH